ncbi:MAG: ArsR family transcriptional regulator [Candidatus Nanohaloarchaea archaeon]
MFDSKNRRLIAETVFDDPKAEHGIRELSEETGLSPSTVSRHVEVLRDEGIVEVEEGVKMRVSGSGTEEFRDLKRCFNLWKLSESGLVEEIEEVCVPEAIVLFGSYSRGEDVADSDIDIAVVNGGEIDQDLSEYEEDLSRRVNIHSVNLEKSKQGFKQTLANGIVLKGYLDI